jgi:hypothetical protein
MGTNYYWIKDKVLNDPDFDLEAVGIHIGKSSAGWAFSLHVTDEIKSLDDWVDKWATGIIVNEYNEEITPEDMLACITQGRCRNHEAEGSDPMGYASWEEFHRKNGSFRDNETGCLRIRVGGRCVANGKESYDLVEGSFC